MRSNDMSLQVQNYVDHLCYRMAHSELRSCRISHPFIDDSHLSKIVASLPRAYKLRKLEISQCPNINACGIVNLCHQMTLMGQSYDDGNRNNLITHLNLDRVSVGDEGLEAITKLLLQNKARKKSNEHKETTDSIVMVGLEGVGEISSNVWDNFLDVACVTLESLDLSSNMLSPRHMSRLAAGLEISETLKVLILSENPIGDNGLHVLRIALAKNRSLYMLGLGGCHLTDEGGMMILASALQSNCSLHRLYVYGNPNMKAESYQHCQVRYWLDLNHKGRGLLRTSNDRYKYQPQKFLSNILAKSAYEPSMIYGLLRDTPHIWV